MPNSPMFSSLILLWGIIVCVFALLLLDWFGRRKDRLSRWATGRRGSENGPYVPHEGPLIRPKSGLSSWQVPTPPETRKGRGVHGTRIVNGTATSPHWS